GQGRHDAFRSPAVDVRVGAVEVAQDFVIRWGRASKTNQSCGCPTLSSATASPSSNGVLNLGVGGGPRSIPTRLRSWNEYRQRRRRPTIRSRRRARPGISTVARGMRPKALRPAMKATYIASYIRSYGMLMNALSRTGRAV